MIYDYQTLNTSITTAIEGHLTGLAVLPPSVEIPKLVGEITQVVFSELNKFDVNEVTLTTLWNTPKPRAAVQGRV